MLKSKTNYSCPNCDLVVSDRSLELKTEPEFVEEPDPHYSWTETHKCLGCETIFTLENGT
jgi:hypothetical protein